MRTVPNSHVVRTALGDPAVLFLFICNLLQEFWCLQATFQVQVLIVCKYIVYPCSVGRGQTLFLSSFRVASEGLEDGEGGLGGFRCRFFSRRCQLEQYHK